MITSPQFLTRFVPLICLKRPVRSNLLRKSPQTTYRDTLNATSNQNEYHNRQNLMSIVANWILLFSALGLTASNFGIVITEGDSMQPTLNPDGSSSKDIILIQKRFSTDDIHRGSIVVFDYNENDNINYDNIPDVYEYHDDNAYNGNQSVHISDKHQNHDNKIYNEDDGNKSVTNGWNDVIKNGLTRRLININGQKFIKRVTNLEGDIVHQGKNSFKSNAITIPKGYIWVTGDNAKVSYDSNQIGPIRVSSVNGIAKVIIWPPNRFWTFL